MLVIAMAGGGAVVVLIVIWIVIRRRRTVKGRRTKVYKSQAALPIFNASEFHPTTSTASDRQGAPKQQPTELPSQTMASPAKTIQLQMLDPPAPDPPASALTPESEKSLVVEISDRLKQLLSPTQSSSGSDQSFVQGNLVSGAV